MDLCVAALRGDTEAAGLLLKHGADVNARDGNDESALCAAASHGHIEVVRLLLEHGADVNAQYGNRQTALNNAASKRHTKIVQLLLEQGADVHARGLFGKSTLYIAASRGYKEIVKLLLERGADANAQTGGNETTLYTSASGGYIEIVQLLLERGADVNAQGINNESALHVTSFRGYIEIVKLLLERGADVNAQGSENKTALYTATLGGQIEIVRLLLQRGADVNAQGSDQKTALHTAASRGHTEIAQLLLEQGADVNFQGARSEAALHIAASCGNTEVVRLLLKHGASLNARDDNDQTVLCAATSYGHIEIVRLLLEHGADVNARDSNDQTALCAAASHGHTDVVLILLNHGADVNARDGKEAALCAAASHGHTDVVLILLNHGADVNARDGNKAALCVAASHGHTDVVLILLNHGADINARDGNEAALCAAISRRDIEVVRLLLKHGADVNARDGNRSAICAAASYGYIEVVRLLLEYGTDVNAKNGNEAALCAAASHGHTEVMLLLLELGADVNARDSDDQTALCAAASHGHTKAVCILLNHGMDVNDKDSKKAALCAAASHGHTNIVRFLLKKRFRINAKDDSKAALYTAASNGHIEVVRLLLELGADVNTRDSNGQTALYAAASNGHIDVVLILLNHGADVNAKNGNEAALCAAASHGHTEVVLLLLELGADVNARDSNGQTALCAAASHGHKKVVRILIKHGADVNTQGARSEAALYGADTNALRGGFGTALRAAIMKDHCEIVQLLLDYVADANIQGAVCEAAFQAAALNGSMNVARDLLNRYGDKIQIADEVLRNFLEASESAVQLMTLLLQKQGDKITITEEILITAAQSKRGHQLVSLFLESSVKISDDVIWARELGEVGYSTQEIMELLLEDSNDSPWIFFESTRFPYSEIKPGQHIPGCCHLVSPLESLPMQIFDTVYERHSINIDHQGIILQVQELCGLAGIKPTTRRLTDWIGHIEFNDSNQVLSVSYTLPTDEKNPPNNKIFWTRISRALDGFYHAAALLQASNLCCNSFTVLRSGFPGHEQPSSYLVEIIKIPFGPVLTLIQVLQKVMSGEFESSDIEKLFSTSTAILELIWPEITEIPDDSTIEWRLYLCSLTAQFLCLGFLSYCQAHIGSVQPFFLDCLAQQVRLMGIQKENFYPFLIAELVNLTCLDNMTRGPVLLFRSSTSLPQNQSLETQSQRMIQKHDVLGHTEDILDTWGPGNLILRGDGSRAPVAIKIGDGFIFAHEGAKFHWSHQIPDKKDLSSIDIEQSLLIGSLVAVNAACKPIEADSRIISANLLEELGTSRSFWQKSQRQLAIQGGQYVVCQATETWNKQTGIPVKDRALAYPSEVLIQYLDYYWGLQVSYCTGVAKRVRLRKLVADLVQHFSAGSALNFDTLEAKMNGQTLRTKDLQIWLNSLSPEIRAEILNIICDILNTLRHTGLDSTGTYFCVAWPFEGNITQCFKIPLEHDSSWARFLADSHDCATFAYITLDCFETAKFRCREIPEPCLKIRQLETAVSRSRMEKHELFLQHHEICFFSKQDTLFWVKVLKKHSDQPANLIDMMHIQSIPYSIIQRIYLSERRKQRSRLRECATMWTQGEAVLVFSVRRPRKSL